MSRTVRVGDIRMDIVGDNADGYEIFRGNEHLVTHWLYPYVNNPGVLMADEVAAVEVENLDANFAFAWGHRNDLLYAIAVRGSEVVTTLGRYHRHDQRNLEVSFLTTNVARFSKNNDHNYMHFDDIDWHWLR